MAPKPSSGLRSSEKGETVPAQGAWRKKTHAWRDPWKRRNTGHCPVLCGPTESSRTEQAAVDHPGWAVRAFIEQCFGSKSGLGGTRFIELPDLAWLVAQRSWLGPSMLPLGEEHENHREDLVLCTPAAWHILLTPLKTKPAVRDTSVLLTGSHGRRSQGILLGGNCPECLRGWGGGSPSPLFCTVLPHIEHTKPSCIYNRACMSLSLGCSSWSFNSHASGCRPTPLPRGHLFHQPQTWSSRPDSQEQGQALNNWDKCNIFKHLN